MPEALSYPEYAALWFLTGKAWVLWLSQTLEEENLAGNPRLLLISLGGSIQTTETHFLICNPFQFHLMVFL